MNISINQKRKQKNFIKMFTVIFLLVAASGLVVYLNRSSIFSNTTNSTQHQATDTTPTQNNSSSSETVVENPDNTIKSNTGQVNLILVDASQYDNIFEIRSYANTSEPGSCIISLSKSSSTITKTVKVLSNGSTAVCETIDISLAEFTESGAWSLKITYSSDNGNYTGSTTQTVTIKK